MDKRTICLLNDSFPPEIDGVANAVVNYAKNITKSGENAIVVTPTMPGADDSAFPFPVLRYPSIDTRKKLGYVAGYPFSPETARVLTEQKVELMHTHCPITSCLLARSLRAVVDAPLVLTYHTKYDVDIAKAVRGKLLQESAIRALVQNIASCDEVWVVSRGAGENLRSLGYEGDYIVMENGVDFPRGRATEAEIAAITQRHHLPQDRPVFLFIGRMRWYKGIRLILDGLAQARAQGARFTMLFVGDGTDMADIQALARENGLWEDCVFAGAVRDRELLRAYYSRGDLFLFPSTFDTNGIVVREAAACALPALLGGILLGIIEIFAKAFNTNISDAVVFLVLIVVLLVKPNGRRCGRARIRMKSTASARPRRSASISPGRMRCGGLKSAMAKSWPSTPTARHAPGGMCSPSCPTRWRPSPACVS